MGACGSYVRVGRRTCASYAWRAGGTRGDLDGFWEREVHGGEKEEDERDPEHELTPRDAKGDALRRKGGLDVARRHARRASLARPHERERREPMHLAQWRGAADPGVRAAGERRQGRGEVEVDGTELQRANERLEVGQRADRWHHQHARLRHQILGDTASVSKQTDPLRPVSRVRGVAVVYEHAAIRAGARARAHR
eukprot:3445429-Prymnesium_polylepis.1